MSPSVGRCPPPLLVSTPAFRIVDFWKRKKQGLNKTQEKKGGPLCQKPFPTGHPVRMQHRHHASERREICEPQDGITSSVLLVFSKVEGCPDVVQSMTKWVILERNKHTRQRPRLASLGDDDHERVERGPTLAHRSFLQYRFYFVRRIWVNRPVWIFETSPTRCQIPIHDCWLRHSNVHLDHGSSNNSKSLYWQKCHDRQSDFDGSERHDHPIDTVHPRH